MKDLKHTPLKILLADDDSDDRFFFERALKEIAIPAVLSTVENGDLLISRLKRDDLLPDVLFLDLNMPLKNGIECLRIIKATKKLENLPVVIYSTSLHTDMADLLYTTGAYYYIKKAEFNDLKKILSKVLPEFTEKGTKRPTREMFAINALEIDH